MSENQYSITISGELTKESVSEVVKPILNRDSKPYGYVSNTSSRSLGLLIALEVPFS